MPEIITIQIGQCGNQIGSRFWDLALHEHRESGGGTTYNDALGSFFRNVDARTNDDLPVGSHLSDLRARAILVDMEDRVVGETQKSGDFGQLFDTIVMGSEGGGSGNNWGVGYHTHGAEYHEQLTDVIRRSVERCSSLQSFFIMHSMGGGTGSGLGTYILSLLADEYPEVYRFVTAVFPSDRDDVVTSPYNTMLALKQIVEYADCVLPVENQALEAIGATINVPTAKGKARRESGLVAGAGQELQEEKPFDAQNNIVAKLLLHLTSSMRFEGSLNVDLNEITMNLVPFPRLKFLLPALTPLVTLKDVGLQARGLTDMYTQAFSPAAQLVRLDPLRSTYLACALLARGDIDMSDMRSNIDRIKADLKPRFIHWNTEGWKVGLCAVPPLQHSRSLLCLSNNTCMRFLFENCLSRFSVLYRAQSHIHHYTNEGVSDDDFREARSDIQALIAEYSELEMAEADDEGTSERPYVLA